MFRVIYFSFLCGCHGAFASAQPVLNVIAEPPVAAESSGAADAFGDVSAAAAGLIRHAREREQVLEDGVGAMLASKAPPSSVSQRIRPVAMLAAKSAAVAHSADTPELHILPPVQKDEDVLIELDGVMQAEEAKRKLADEIFSGDKQRMLDIERAELRRIIRDVLG